MLRFTFWFLMRSAFIIIVLQMSTVQTNKQTNKLVKHANFDIALKKLFKGSQLGAFCPYISVLLPWIQTSLS